VRTDRNIDRRQFRDHLPATELFPDLFGKEEIRRVLHYASRNFARAQSCLPCNRFHEEAHGLAVAADHASQAATPSWDYHLGQRIIQFYVNDLVGGFVFI
jgi:hypothetical protein